MKELKKFFLTLLALTLVLGAFAHAPNATADSTLLNEIVAAVTDQNFKEYSMADFDNDGVDEAIVVTTAGAIDAGEPVTLWYINDGTATPIVEDTYLWLEDVITYEGRVFQELGWRRYRELITLEGDTFINVALPQELNIVDIVLDENNELWATAWDRNDDGSELTQSCKLAYDPEAVSFTAEK